MRIMIDISKDRYDEIMSMDWKNCRLIFGEEIRAIHDGKVLEQEPKTDALDKIRAEVTDVQWIGYAIVNGKRKIASKAALDIIDKYRQEK